MGRNAHFCVGSNIIMSKFLVGDIVDNGYYRFRITNVNDDKTYDVVLIQNGMVETDTSCLSCKLCGNKVIERVLPRLVRDSAF